MLLGTGNSFSFLIVFFFSLPVCEAEGRRKKWSFQIFLHKITLCMTKLIFFAVSCCSRKYPNPHHGGNWKFQRGGRGVEDPGNSTEKGGGGGVHDQFNFQRSFNSIRI